jgi:hypothetical protein
MAIAGHQFVNADCSRLSQTNTVRHSQYEPVKRVEKLPIA